MRRIVCIACVSQKQTQAAPAKDLYISDWFKKALAYTEQILKPDEVFILSAKYGLLNLDEVIEPYNVTLNQFKTSEVKAWANRVLEQLQSKVDVEEDEVIFLAGERYRKFLEPAFKHSSVPMKGLGIGQQLKFLKEGVSC